MSVAFNGLPCDYTSISIVIFKFFPLICIHFYDSLFVHQFLLVSSSLLRHDGSSGTRGWQRHGWPEVDGLLGVLVTFARRGNRYCGVS